MLDMTTNHNMIELSVLQAKKKPIMTTTSYTLISHTASMTLNPVFYAPSLLWSISTQFKYVRTGYSPYIK
ncbi:hypothetical protein J7T55_005952 [Diaporthe amygdali]|uniref:uncharacterized protein n=1 Tax=Phomopsis amygdali TaxID=1214568 RepID=UPI0022FE293A|nr:uncharacterized protein J7T55_005952 [Diaporthe amygdali]KAJ0124613.1 hypothetical protein J7T55_005952 [Diaporthe amygdali]